MMAPSRMKTQRQCYSLRQWPASKSFSPITIEDDNPDCINNEASCPFGFSVDSEGRYDKINGKCVCDDPLKHMSDDGQNCETGYGTWDIPILNRIHVLSFLHMRIPCLVISASQNTKSVSSGSHITRKAPKTCSEGRQTNVAGKEPPTRLFPNGPML